jgi:hypothetical protein
VIDSGMLRKILSQASPIPMKRLVTILLPTATLVIGLIGGWSASAHFHNRWMESHMKTEQYNHLSQRCRVLVQLRAGKTNEAVETLETLMDGDILGFGSFLRAAPFNEQRAADIKLLTTVRDYRAKHPWKSAGYPAIDEAVTEVFSSVSTNHSR